MNEQNIVTIFALNFVMIIFLSIFVQYSVHAVEYTNTWAVKVGFFWGNFH